MGLTCHEGCASTCERRACPARLMRSPTGGSARRTSRCRSGRYPSTAVVYVAGGADRGITRARERCGERGRTRSTATAKWRLCHRSCSAVAADGRAGEIVARNERETVGQERLEVPVADPEVQWVDARRVDLDQDVVGTYLGAGTSAARIPARPPYFSTMKAFIVVSVPFPAVRGRGVRSSRPLPVRNSVCCLLLVRRGRTASSAAFTAQATGTTGTVTRSAAPPWRRSREAAILSWGAPSGTALT